MIETWDGFTDQASEEDVPDKNISIPRRHLDAQRRHPWHLLTDIGCSLFIETSSKAGVILTGAKQYARRRNIAAKYTTRVEIKNDGKRGIRIWRIA